MNAYQPPELVAFDTKAAIADANEWRGATINQFAHGERILRKALEARDPSHGALLTGQVIDRLSKLENDRELDALLDEYRSHHERRHALVHGVGSVYCDKMGNWCLRLDYRHGRSERRDVHFEDDGKRLKSAIQSVSDRIRNRLRIIRD